MKVLGLDYYNGGIDLNTFAGSAKSSYLHGNVGDKVKAVITLEIDQVAKATDIDPLVFTVATNDCIIRTNSLYFVSQKGFSNGQTIKIKDGSGTLKGTAVIYALDDNTIYCTLGGGHTMATGSQTAYYIYTEDNIGGLVYTSNLLENDSSYSAASLLNGKENQYYYQGFGVPGATVYNMSRKGATGIHQIGSTTCKYVSNTSGVHKFEITETLYIAPVYLATWEQNYKDGTTPDLFSSKASLKHVFSIDARFDYNDPNSRIYAEYSATKGSVGWYNEEFNGNAKRYSISSFAFSRVDNSKSLTGLHAGTKTRVNVVLTSSGLFGANTVFGANIFSASALDTGYDYATMNLFECLQQKGAGTANGTRITNFVVVINTSSQATLNFDVEYSGGFNGNDYKDLDFITWISVATYNNAVSTSDKTSLLLCKRPYEYQSDIEGLLTWGTVQVFEYPDSSLVSPKTGIAGWPKDDFVVKFAATIKSTLGATLSGLRVDTVAIKTATGERFVIDSRPVNLGNPVIDQYKRQYFNISATRGLNKPSGDKFNLVELISDNSASDSVISGKFAFHLPWQDWIKNTAVDTVFADITKSNNNLNKKASNYDETNGYKVYISVVCSVKKEGTGIPAGGLITDYAKNIDVEVRDYGADGNATPKWGVAITTLDGNGNDTGGVISTSGYTNIKAVFTPISLGLLSKPSQFGRIWLEEKNQADETHFEIGTAKLDPTNTLVPLSGEPFVKKTVGASNITLEARIDGTKIGKDKVYNINSRLYYDATPIPDYPYDLLAGSFTLLSVYRRCKNGYTGAFIDVRRASDNAVQSFGSISGDVIDEAGIATFCSGTTGYLQKVYDQSGNSRHRYQIDWSRQPVIYTGGALVKVNGKLAAQFADYTDNLPFVSNLFTSGVQYSIFATYKRTNNSSVLYLAGTNQYAFAGTSGSGSATHGQLTVASNYVNNVAKTITTQGQAYTELAANAYVLHEIHGLNPSGTWNNILTFGGYGLFGFGYEWLGYYQEELIWSGDQSANRAAIKDNINGIYGLW